MDNNEIFKDNIFIRKALNLYHDLQSGNVYYDDEVRVVTDSRIIGNFYKKKIEYEKRQYPKVIKYNEEAKGALFARPLLFSDMWQFCQFIRWAEKTVFYKNTTDKEIYVDSAIDDLDCRLLVFKGDEYQALFKLEKIDNPAYSPNTLSDILSMKKNDAPRYFKSMKIMVEREYGKKMQNHFTILDDNIDFPDFSDTLLYEFLENKIRDACIKITTGIFDIIYETYKVEC